MLHKKHHVTRDVYDLSCERVAKCLKQFDTVVVWFSGGKDSTVALHVTLDAAKALNKSAEIAFFDEEAIPPETVEYCERVRQLHPSRFHWLCFPIKHRNACSRRSPWWYPWAPEDRDKWTREYPAVGLGPERYPLFQRTAHEKMAGMVFPPNYGRVCSIMGIRTQESLNRFQAIASFKTGHDAFFAADHWRHVTRAYPIYDWAHEDVWHAPERFGWDYNHAYDLMQKAGVPIHNQRCAPPFGEQPLERLWTYHVCWPQLWDKMTARVPGAATAGRYSRTPLYGYGQADDQMKPDGISWQDFIYKKINEYPEKDRAMCAKGVRRFLDDHAMKTKDPVPEDTPHPETGVCWMTIAKIVFKGDLKGRKTISLRAAARLYVERKRESKAATNV